MAKQKEIAEQLAQLTGKIEEADSALDAKLRALIDTTKTDVMSSLETVKSEMKNALDAKEEALSATQKALETAKTALEAADAALGARIGDLGTKCNDEKATMEKATASLGGRVDALDSSIAAIKSDFRTAVGACASKAELGAIAEQIKGLEDRTVEKITALTNSAADMEGLNVLNGKVGTLETDVATLQNKFVAFNGEEARKGKEGYVFDLVMTYADFDGTMERSYAAAYDRLVADAHLEEEAAKELLAPVFDSIKTSWSHVMLGYLHRGTTLITLGEDLAQSEAYKNEYAARLNSYVLYVDFEVHKATVKYTIGTNGNIPADAIEHILSEVEAIVYTQKTADVMGSTADVMAYYNGLIGSLDMWQRRAAGLNAIYGKLEEVKAAVVDLGTEFITEEQQQKLLADLAAVVVNENYYAVTDSEEDADAVSTLVAKNSAAMDLIVTQATVYNRVMAYAKDAKEKIDQLELPIDADKNTAKKAIDAAVTALTSYRALASDEEVAATEASDKAAMDLYVAQVSKYNDLLAYLNKQTETVNGLECVADGDKATACKTLTKVAVFNNYFAKLADTEAIEAQFASDKAAMDLYVAQVSKYNDLLAYLNKKIEIVNGLECVAGGDKATACKALTKVAVFNNYFAKLADTEAIEAQYASDKAAMDLYVAQVSKYNDLLAYLNKQTETVNGLECVAGGDKATACKALAKVAVFNNYFATLADTEAIEAQYASDKAAIDLYVAQVNKYNDLLAYLNKKIEIVNEHAYLSDAEKETSVGLLSAVAVFNNYFAKLADTDAIEAQYASDKAAIDLLSFRINQFNLAEKYAADAKASYGATYDSDEYSKEKALVEGYIDAVSTLDAYINAVATEEMSVEDAVKDMCAKDSVKVDVLVQRLATYKAVYDLITAKNKAIDDMDPNHNNTKKKGCGKAGHGEFVAQDKDAFKAKYADYLAKFDDSVDAKAFATVEEVKAYEAAITETVELVVCSAATFCDIIKLVADTEDAIDSLKVINDINGKTADTFKARFSAYALYATHEANTNTADESAGKVAFANKAEYDAYKSAVTTKVTDTKVIAENENAIVESILNNKEDVAIAFEASRISKAEKNYLNKVLESIYAAHNNIAIEETAVAIGNSADAKAESTEVSSTAGLFEKVDTKADILNNATIPAYLKTLKNNFYNNFYEDTYKDAETVWNKYYNDTPYSADALTLASEPTVVDKQVEYMVTIETRVQNTKFIYALPGEFDYATFHAFKVDLESQNIPGRLHMLRHWAETNYTEEGAVDGGVFAKMTASFDALESKRLIVARNTFTKYLTEKFDQFKTECGGTKKSELTQVYNLTKGSIDVAPKTADVVNFYNNGYLQFARIRCDFELETCYNELLVTAKEKGKTNELVAAYKGYIKELSNITDEKVFAEKLPTFKAALTKIVKAKK